VAFAATDEGPGERVFLRCSDPSSPDELVESVDCGAPNIAYDLGGDLRERLEFTADE